MSRQKTTYQRVFRIAIILFSVLFLSIELLFRMYGLPRFCRRLIEDSIAHAGVYCRFSWGRASFFSGLSFQGVTVKIDTALGPLVLTAQEATTSFNAIKLIQKKFLPDGIRLNAASLQLISDNGISILDCKKLFFHARRIEKDKLFGVLTLSQNGISIKGEITLENYQHLPQQLRHLLSENDSFSADQYAKTSSFLESLHQHFETCEFGENDTLLSFTCHGDVKDWNSLCFAGNFDLNYGRIGPVLIEKQRGHFQYRQQLFELTNLHWLFSSNEQIQANVSVNFAEQSIAADFNGRLTPDTCLRLMMHDPPAWSDFVECPAPIFFQGKLPPAKWDFSNAEPQMHCTVKSLSIMGTQFQQGKFSLCSKNGILFLDDLSLSLDFRQTTGIQGNLRWHLADKKINAALEGRFNLQEIIHNHGLNTKEFDSVLSDFDDVRIKFSLFESPLDWHQWHLEGELVEAGGEQLGLRFQNLVFPFRIEDGWVHIDDGKVELKQQGQPRITINGKGNLDDLIKKQSLEGDLGISISSAKADKEGMPETVTARAMYRLDLKNLRLQLADGDAALIPNLFLDTFHEQLQKIYAPLPRFLAGENPAKIRFNIPEFDLTRKDSWLILLHLDAENIKFRHLDIHKVNADGKISAEQADFDNIRALVNENEDFSLDLSIHFNPASIVVKNAVVHARPELFDAFIFNTEASDIYLKIWEDITWDMHALPEVRISELLYWEAPSNTYNWQLKIDATLELQNAFFKEFSIPGGSIGLKLELPEALTLEPVILKTRQGEINAKVAFSFSGIPSCSFALDETQVPLDIILLLKSINDDWQDFLDLITLHPDAKIDCKGAFDFANNHNLQISGNMLSPEVTFRKAQLQEVLCRWNYQANRLFWNIPEAYFLGARLNNTGFYDFQTNSAESLLKIRNLPLNEAENFFLNKSDSPRKNPLGGVIDCDCRISLLKNWAESPFYLEGDGHFNLSDADLWQMPLMNNLASILSLGSMQLFSRDKVSNLGNISRLDADFVLRGDRLLVNRFDTNGTILSLHGNGEYAWNKDKLHFTVKGEALKNVNLLSFMLKPLSWAFDAELNGPLKKPEWKIRSALNKVFETQ